jgi:hypothetical protein
MTSSLRARLQRLIRRGSRAADWIIAVILLLALFNDGVTVDPSLAGRVSALARDEVFDYVTWEVDALWSKARQELFGVHPYLKKDEQRQVLFGYLETLGQAQTLEAQIERVYSDPSVSDPAAATAGLRAQRDDLRRQLADDQRLVEGIVEEQVSAVLIDEGFGVLGQVLPPVAMHFSELPTALIVSPRDRIEIAAENTLIPLTVDQEEALEAKIDAELDVSSLVVPLGGLSLYPSMVEEPDYPPDALNWNLARAFEVTAHEWSHHYLLFFPLGLEYESQPETRIINETTATFFGRAVALKVMQRYYPDLAAPVYPSFLNASQSNDPAADPAAPLVDPEAPEPFDFYRELNKTRVYVDYLLWLGKVRAAELTMESERHVFVRQGYLFRKLNQAYFAFYGGYQGEPGAGGTDPIGPAIETLQGRSRSLSAWLATMRGMTTREQLLAAAGERE